MDEQDARWETAKRLLPIGSLVGGFVTRHEDGGLYVDIGLEFEALIPMVDVRDAHGPIPAEELPAPKTRVVGVVMGFRDTGRQIWLSLKESQLEKARAKT